MNLLIVDQLPKYKHNSLAFAKTIPQFRHLPKSDTTTNGSSMASQGF